MNVGGLWSRVSSLGRGGPASQLQTDLRKITDAELLEAPPKDVLLSVTTATNVEDDRREILLHLQECLAETSSKRWRRVHGGLVLLEHLLRHGSPTVITEIAEGRHFDPVQRLTFLEKFEYGDDKRVQNVVRQKATTLRAEMVARLQDPHGAAPPAASASSSKGASPGTAGSGGGGSSSGRFVGFGSDGPAEAEKPSPGSMGSSTGYVGFGSDSFPAFDQGAASKSKVVNGLVAVGHRDDTDSESEDERSRRKGGSSSNPASSKKAGGTVLPPDRRKPMEDSTDSDSSGGGRRRARRKGRSPKAAAPPAPKPAEADLLGGFDEAPAAKPPPPARQEDLLDGMFGDPAPAAVAEKPAVAPGGGDLLDF